MTHSSRFCSFFFTFLLNHIPLLRHRYFFVCLFHLPLHLIQFLGYFNSGIQRTDKHSTDIMLELRIEVESGMRGLILGTINLRSKLEELEETEGTKLKILTRYQQENILLHEEKIRKNKCSSELLLQYNFLWPDYIFVKTCRTLQKQAVTNSITNLISNLIFNRISNSLLC